MQRKATPFGLPDTSSTIHDERSSQVSATVKFYAGFFLAFALVVAVSFYAGYRYGYVAHVKPVRAAHPAAVRRTAP